MGTKNKRWRFLSAFFCAVLIISALTSCFKKTITYESDASGELITSSAAEEEASVDSQSDGNSSDETDAESELFLTGVGSVLLDAVHQSDLLASNRFDILIGLGYRDIGVYDNTYTTLHMVSVNGETDDETTYTVRQHNSNETSDASMAVGVQSDDGLAECAVYFYDNMMLMKKANVEKAMILHSMNPQVAASYSGLPALERFNRVMNDTSVPRLTDDGWTAAIEAYLAQVGDIAKDPDYSTAEDSAFYAGITMDCTTTTLKLMGERALSVVRGLVELIGRDATFQALFNSLYMVDEDEYGVTGLDGMLRDIDALDGNERDGAIMTLELVEAESPIGIYVTLTAGEKTFRLNLAFYEDGDIRCSDITFEGFDGSSAVVQDENVSTGPDTYAESFVYLISGPGGTVQETMTADVQSTVGNNSFDAQTQLYYYREAVGDLDEIGMSGTIIYSHTKSDDAVNGSAYGTLELIGNGEKGTYNVDMNVERNNDEVTAAIPELLADSYISTADQYGLYAALGDFDGASFILSPATTQLFAEWMLIYY